MTKCKMCGAQMNGNKCKYCGWEKPQDSEEIQAEKQKIEVFKKSKFSKVIIVFGVICLLMGLAAFTQGKVFCGIVGLVQTALFATAWLMGIGVIKEKKNNLHLALAVAGFACIALFLFGTNMNKASSKTYDKIQWPNSTLAQMLPTPSSQYGSIHRDSDKELSIDINKFSSSDYEKYITSCKDKGFSVGGDRSSSSYKATNNEGYALELYFYSTMDEMSIKLRTPQKVTEDESSKAAYESSKAATTATTVATKTVTRKV